MDENTERLLRIAKGLYKNLHKMIAEYNSLYDSVGKRERQRNERICELACDISVARGRLIDAMDELERVLSN